MGGQLREYTQKVLDERVASGKSLSSQRDSTGIDIRASVAERTGCSGGETCLVSMKCLQANP